MFAAIAAMLAKTLVGEVVEKVGRDSKGKYESKIKQRVSKGLLNSKTVQGAGGLAALPLIFPLVDDALPPDWAPLGKLVIALALLAWTCYGRATADKPLVKKTQK